MPTSPEHLRPGRRVRSVTYPAYRGYDVPVPEDCKPIVLYLRLSKYHSDGADAIERQRLDLTRKLDSEGGWTVIGEYLDNDSASSSAVRTRKGWQALNQAISDGSVTAVAFWKLDRTNRIASQIIEWLGVCRQRGVTLVSHEDSSSELNEASASAKLVVGIKSLFAEIETDTMSARQQAAKRHAAEAGFNHGGGVPFGWVIGPRTTDEHGRTGTRLEPHPVEFDALQDAVRMVINGASLHTVSRHWKEQYGIAAASGAEIAHGNVRRYLVSPRLMGYRMRKVPEHQRGVRLNLLDYIARDRNGDPVISQEAVCDRVTWMRLQRAFADAPVVNRRPWGANEWLLTGLLVCGSCGARLHGRARKGSSGQTERRYVCITNLAWRPGSCIRMVSIAANRVERFVLGWVAAHLTPDRLAEQEELLGKARADSPAFRLAIELDTARLELRHLLDQQGGPQWKGAKVSVLLGMVSDAVDRVEILENAIHAGQQSRGLMVGPTLLSRWEGLEALQN